LVDAGNSSWQLAGENSLPPFLKLVGLPSQLGQPGRAGRVCAGSSLRLPSMQEAVKASAGGMQPPARGLCVRLLGAGCPRLSVARRGPSGSEGERGIARLSRPSSPCPPGTGDPSSASLPLALTP